MAPFEWSCPYHSFIKDEMTKSMKERMHLPAAETAHLTHVMFQTVKGLMLGSTGKASTWTRHILKTTTGKILPYFCGWNFKMDLAKHLHKIIMDLVGRMCMH